MICSVHGWLLDLYFQRSEKYSNRKLYPRRITLCPEEDHSVPGWDLDMFLKICTVPGWVLGLSLFLFLMFNLFLKNICTATRRVPDLRLFLNEFLISFMKKISTVPKFPISSGEDVQDLYPWSNSFFDINLHISWMSSWSGFEEVLHRSWSLFLKEMCMTSGRVTVSSEIQLVGVDVFLSSPEQDLPGWVPDFFFERSIQFLGKCPIWRSEQFLRVVSISLLNIGKVPGWAPKLFFLKIRTFLKICAGPQCWNKWKTRKKFTKTSHAQVFLLVFCIFFFFDLTRFKPLNQWKWNCFPKHVSSVSRLFLRFGDVLCLWSWKKKRKVRHISG